MIRALGSNQAAGAADGYIFQIAQNLLIDRARRSKVRDLHAQTVIAEIAELLGYPSSSTSALVNSLKQLGYLNFNVETHEFAPSVRIGLVGGT